MSVQRFFHSVKENEYGELQIVNQGKILEATSYNAIVQLFSWMSGEPTQKMLVGHDYLKNCVFYKTDIQMRMASMLYNDIANKDGKYFMKNMNGFLDAVDIVKKYPEEAKKILSKYGYIGYK